MTKPHPISVVAATRRRRATVGGRWLSGRRALLRATAVFGPRASEGAKRLQKRLITSSGTTVSHYSAVPLRAGTVMTKIHLPKRPNSVLVLRAKSGNAQPCKTRLYEEKEKLFERKDDGWEKGGSWGEEDSFGRSMATVAILLILKTKGRIMCPEQHRPPWPLHRPQL